MVRVTSARPSGGRLEVPAKITSSILPPRRDLALCSPITQARASTTFDLPEPFGPTTQVMPGSSRSVVAEAKDLKPRKVSVLRYTSSPLTAARRFGEDYRSRAARDVRCGPSAAVAPHAGARPVAVREPREGCVNADR